MKKFNTQAELCNKMWFVPFKKQMRPKKNIACGCTPFDAKPRILHDFIVKGLNNNVF